MAKMEIAGLDGMMEKLRKIQGSGIRTAVKRIVTAGAEADAKMMMGSIRSAGHVRTGSMADNVRGGDYHETLGGGEINVYPQGEDSHGTSNALKAYVINYGRGNRRSKRMGDKFITGNQNAAEKAVSAAMQDEAEKVFREMGITD